MSGLTDLVADLSALTSNPEAFKQAADRSNDPKSFMKGVGYLAGRMSAILTEHEIKDALRGEEEA